MSLYSRYPCINHGRQHPTFLPAPVSFYEVYDIDLSVVTPDLTFFGRRSRTDSRGIFQPVRRDAVAILLEGKEKEKKRRKKKRSVGLGLSVHADESFPCEGCEKD